MGIFNVQLCKLCVCRWMGIFMHARADALFGCLTVQLWTTWLCKDCNVCNRASLLFTLCTCDDQTVHRLRSRSCAGITDWSNTLVPCELGATFALQHVHNMNHSLLEPESTIFCHSFSSSVSTPPIFASHHRSCWQRRVGGSANQESSPLVDHMTTDRCLIASPESLLLYTAFTSTFHHFATLEMLSLFYCAIWITMIQIQSL